MRRLSSRSSTAFAVRNVFSGRKRCGAPPGMMIVRPSCGSSTAALHHPMRAVHDAPLIDAEEVLFYSGNEANEEARTSGHTSFTAAAHAVSSRDVPLAFLDVDELSTYSRAKVINFLKRYRSDTSVKARGEDAFLVEPIAPPPPDDDDDSSSTLYHCAVHLPLRVGELEGLWAHGVASSAKDAEHLAAMHAEYLIDFLGYPIYTLPSMQRKHADAARAAGRPAPYPDEHIMMAPSTAEMPLPMRRIICRDESEGGAWQMMDVDAPPFLSTPHAVLSPCVLDSGAEHRLQQFFRSHGSFLPQHCEVRQDARIDGGGAPMFVASITLPPTILGTNTNKKHNGAVMARGKAPRREVAIQLAAMHAELLLDVLHVPLFPDDDGRQKLHALAAWDVGRPAPLPGAAPKSAEHLCLPLPLKALVLANPPHRVCACSAEESVVLRHRSLASHTTEFLDTLVEESTAVADLQRFLTAHANTTKRIDVDGVVVGARIGNPFFIISLSPGIFRSTVLLPLPEEYGVRGGVGVASKEADANTLAAMHALDVLVALGLWKEGLSETWRHQRATLVGDVPRWASIRAQDASPPGRRHRFGSSWSRAASITDDPTEVVPSSATTTTTTSSPESMRDARVPRRVAKRAHSSNLPEDQRATVAREHWDLSPDTSDGFILVKDRDDGDGDGDAVKKSMALRSPREMDAHAKERLQGFLAAHGRQWSEVFQYSTVDDAHTGLPIHRCAGALPLPSKFGPRVALGEAHTRVAAEHLAAMHAELIVDALGIALFSCVEQQTLHAQASWREGRWAWMPSTEHGMDVPADAQSPPPLRRVNEDGDVVPMIAKTPRHRPRHVRRPPTTTTTTTTSAVSSSSAAKDEAVLMELDQLDYTDVTADEVDVVAKARVEYFLRHHAKNTPIQRTSTTVLHKGVLHHMVKWPLPLPTPSGAILHVWVEGCAPTKREAECAAWMHAERTLDALQIPIFGNLPGLQRWHAQRVAALGRSAPTCITAAVVDAHVDRNPVRPLRCCVSMDAPPLRPPPTLVGDGDDAWMAYVEDCRQYVDERRMHSANAFLSREEVPRCGEALVDGALDAMEKLPISVDAKAQLHRYCHEAGTSFPTAWPTTFAGPLVHRVCWCSIVVPGFSHLMAHGVGPNKDAAQRRAAMHAMALLKVVDENYAANEMAAKARVEESTSAESSNVVGDASVMQNRDDVAEEPQQPSMLVRRGRRSRQSAGTADSTESVKQRLVELFSICLDVAPPRVLRCTTRQHKEDGFISFTHHVRVEVVDEDGKVWAGRGEGDGIRANTRAAFAAVHAALATGHPLMAAVEELRRKHAWLRPEKIATLTLTEAQQQHIKTMVQNLPDDREVELEELPPPGMEELAPMEEGCGPSAAMTASEVAQKSHELQERLFRRIVSEVYLTNFAKKRESLSIFCHRDAILASIKTHQVTIICGTTGCGKTTQVPQYILDDLTEEGNGGACSIAISQPRRLSAVSIAQRVATERLEVLGQSCGYRIRFDARPGTHINFCTTGILLRMLRSSPTLTGISHIIIDEIHERDINSDFLLVLLRQLIRVRPDVRLILMSATLQSEAFGRYFAGANIIHIEGYNYPVEELFLEDLVPLAETHKVVTPWLKEASRTMQHDTKAASMCVVDPNTRTPSSSSSSSSTKYGVMEATSEIDVATLQFAVEQAARMVNLHSSSVLVFLPGWDDIMQAKNMLERNPAYDIIALHSSVGAEEQMRCFLPAKEGKKKIILATNIAESGITIDDVAAVVDVGRVKEKTNMRHHHRRGEAGGNTHSSISQLLTVYASKANCIQRRGRVGRTRPGVCIRLYTRQHFRELHEFQTPEMLRTPLDGICLQVLALKLGDPLIFLQNAMEPPSQELVEASMARLMQLGAVSRTRQLTALGVRLAALPTDPRMAKMMLMGCIFRCLDTALTIAATNDGDVFLPTREHRDAVRLHREDLAQGTQSDAMAAVNAYNLWVAATQRNEAGSVLADLEDRQLSLTRLVAVTRAKKQFYSLLLASGFIGHDEDALIGPTSAVSRVPRECCVEHSSYSEDAQHAGVVRTVMASSLLPQVAAFTGKRKLATKSEQDVLPHGDSVLHHTPEDEVLQPYFLYAEMTRSQESRKLYVRGLTSISLWSVLLMNPMDVAITYCPDLHVVVVDEWLVCRASFAVVESLRKLRRALHAALTRKFADPTNEENNARLEEMRVFIKDLVSMSIQPNAMATSPWIDRGIIWSPTAAPVAPPPPPPTTTTAAISSSLEDPHTSTTE